MHQDRSTIRIDEERVVYDNPFGRLFDDRVTFVPTEQTGTYVRWQWNAPHSVGVLPILESGGVALIHTFRHGLRGPTLEAPKGFGDHDVPPIEAAERELHEETGLVAAELVPLGVIHQEFSIMDLPMHLFAALGCHAPDAMAPGDPSEPIDAVEVIAFDALLDRIVADPCDAATEILYHRARQRGLIGR